MSSSQQNSAPFLSQSLVQLRALAKRLGLGSYSRLAKAELAEALLRAGSRSCSTAPDTPNDAPGAESTSSQDASLMSTQVTFLPRDPQWAYVFWSISTADRARAAAAGSQQLCLRVADVTGLPLGASHPHALQELVVPADASEWYLPVPLSDRDYRVELGYRLGGGGWLPLALSSVARVPAGGPSPVVADAFLPFSLEGPIEAVSQPLRCGDVQHERLYQMATAAGALSRRVGSELLHEHDFNNEQANQLNASGAGLWASGRNDSGSGVLRERSFWLVADAELIVYGATEPSASLFIGEEHIPLAADGTFRVHVPFHDGEQLYPIRAVAADGEQKRAIRMEFQRSTPQARVNSREEAVAAWF